MKNELLEIFKGEEENLTNRELNVFIWIDFSDEEENLTEKELEAWR